MKRGLILGALVWLSACGGGGQTVTGMLHLYGTVENDGTECWGVGGYGDLSEGTEVTIRDGAGDLIGTGSLDAGTTVGDGDCTFLWKIGSVPEVDFYEIEVSERGGITRTLEEMESEGWTVVGSIGD